MTPDIDFLTQQISDAIAQTNMTHYQKVAQGKVRDTYVHNNKRILITTDRQSAFDRILSAVPFKGQILNLLSAYFFKHTEDIVKNHLIDIPDPNVSICKQATVFPVEFIIRGYMTGSTDTSVWMNYKNGIRDYCGVRLPEGMSKNEAFAKPIITPTTKPETGHDELISPKEIIERKYMTAAEWEEVSHYAMEVFLRGQQMAAEKGLILVDTKFEFGRDVETGEVLLVDEVLTPDSSRYWQAESYEARLSEGKEPESFDKEFLRLWFVDHCDPYQDKVLPEAPPELVAKLAQKYIIAYETITGETFVPTTGSSARIEENLDKYFGNA